MELALQWKICPEMEKKDTTWQNERPWLLPITLLPPKTQHPASQHLPPPSSLPVEQNTESNKKLKEKHYFFLLASPPTASIHMQWEDSSW